ncbi:protein STRICTOSIDINE SYNTHASE-LIKE 12-like [Pistacia vera]|uniref:protein STRICTOSIDINE SYNTHASE-LIKE 12-like n=1 Tax=Pistacia vera TaxID=55513 RepID=UPI001262C9CE|nr:protein STRICTOSIDINE SYNTHASE-LIKE 12-like [Pistacia vera]
MAEGVSLSFLNGLDTDSVTGDVYFNDAGAVYQLRHVILQEQLSEIGGNTMIHFSVKLNRNTITYFAKIKKVTMLLRGLSEPAGTAVIADGKFILFSKLTGNSFGSKGPKANTSKYFTSSQGGQTMFRGIKWEIFWWQSTYNNLFHILMPVTLRLDAYGNLMEFVLIYP